MKAAGQFAIVRLDVNRMAFFHQGDLSWAEWMTLTWYWLGIPLIVALGIYALMKLGKWSGSSENHSTDKR